MNLQAKAIAVDQVFRPARDIVEATVSDTVQDRFVAPKTSNIKRYVNNYRTAFRPKDHTYLDFEVYYLFMVFMLHITLNYIIRNYLLLQCLPYMYFYFLQINMDFLQCEEFLKADLRVGEEDTWSSLQSTNLIFCNKQRNGTLMAPLRYYEQEENSTIYLSLWKRDVLINILFYNCRLCNPSWNQLAN